jgi:hypothetical protein
MMMSGFHKPVNWQTRAWQTRAANARGKGARQRRFLARPLVLGAARVSEI